ncbi:MAG: tRNA (N(6)-L-threonylcarbamoyladenosine(37)-C(2))-methylthiotransferase MtaB [Alphaproteobacteria bacterium]|nr:tRNA (N(6)-L-threonylcarbamoyladenosine(37)-C(2))-methylthiotransferase MtaB [Alphaproteobacteria bacterium]
MTSAQIKEENAVFLDDIQVVTFGCRLNTYESEVMRNLAKDAGLSKTILVNTCAVTSEAERQARQSIRKIKRDNPDATIIVTGCSAQINPTQYSDMGEVDRVLGNDEKMKRESYLPGLSGTLERVLVNDIMSVKETAVHLISGFEGKVRAFVQVQNGCNHRCTFCTIPYGRGNSRSVPLGEIVNQIKTLLAAGYQEIVFTGVDITDYGKDLPAQPTLGQTIKRLFTLVPELKRLRLSSIDPVEVDEDLWDVIANEPRLMPHLHISLQAGDDLVLKRMKRRHLRQDVVDFCEKAKRVRPDAVFGADIIAGFPTENEAMFKNTLDIVRDCNLTYLHVFPYSKRPGTPAARMPQVDGRIIKERAALLRKAGEGALRRYLLKQIGSSHTMLVEDIENGVIKGKTDTFAQVIIYSDCSSINVGDVIQVTLQSVEGNALVGSL